MNYMFPQIRAIDDVLPHIIDMKQFVVAKREFGTVINYTVSPPGTFDMVDPNDVSGAIRRECRGIIFDNDGKIMSRPFHKFFNLGERDETQAHALDFSKRHRLMTKLDGSMLRPITLNGNIRWATKMGLSDVALVAEKYVKQHEKFEDFARFCIENSLTPIFEYYGPHNKVVLEYDEGMTLLAIRENISGNYLDIHGDEV